MQLSTDYKRPLAFNYDTPEQLPHQCSLAAEILKAQPAQHLAPYMLYTYKSIFLADKNDACIFSIICTASKTLCIDNCGISRTQLEDCAPGQGKLILEVHYGIEYSRDQLKKAYTAVFKSVFEGWVKSNPKSWKGLQFRDIHRKFTLFAKEDVIANEVELIRLLAQKFGFGSHALYGDSNLPEVIWIESSVVPKMVETFGFTFSDEAADCIQYTPLLKESTFATTYAAPSLPGIGLVTDAEILSLDFLLPKYPGLVSSALEGDFALVPENASEILREAMSRLVENSTKLWPNRKWLTIALPNE
jgi:hypothetical protein